jgi:cytochrome c oxidase subunit 2
MAPSSHTAEPQAQPPSKNAATDRGPRIPSVVAQRTEAATVAGPGGEVPSVFSPGSPEARAIADLFGVTLVVCGVIFAVVAGLVAYCILRFRRRDGDGEPRQIEGHTRLEIAWTLAPVAVLVGILALTARTMSAVDPPADREPDLVVIGHQWWWEVRYPASGVVTANEIHVPVGRRLLVGVEAADVIHDFWVPELARKVDAVPGHPNHVWMTVTAPGTYLGACAEYCGAQHAWMRLRVVAQPEAELDAWQAHQAAPAAAPRSPMGASPTNPQQEAAVRGAREFRERTCASCHTVNLAGAGERPPALTLAGVPSDVPPPASPRIAPDLTHLASRATLAGGAIENSPATLARWLADPDSIKPGSHMPNLHLGSAEVSDLVAYFETLR